MSERDRTAGDFRGKRALVTGATGALGGALARRLLDAGARLALPARDPGDLAAGFPEMAAVDGGHFAAACDLTDAGSVARFVEAAVERLGGLDLVANVAGGWAGGKPVHETPVEQWDRMWALNARSAFLVCRTAVPAMLAGGGGAIVNVGSEAARTGGARGAAYAASKAAVVRLTESLAAELAGHGVRVNCVLPGTLDTEANRRAMPDADRSRWVSLDGMADAMLFLLSPAARAVHGAALPVAGPG